MSTRIEQIRVGPLSENVYVVQTVDKSFLVDPGDEAERILAFLQQEHINPELIVFTHGHLDHTAALPDLLQNWPTPLPKIAIHTSDSAYLGARGEATSKTLFERLRASVYFKSVWKKMPEPDILLNDGDVLPGTGFIVLHTPGHSAGSICLYNKADSILISGDTLFRDGVGRTDGPDSDTRSMHESLRKLYHLPPETTVYPGHGLRTTIGRELNG